MDLRLNLNNLFLNMKPEILFDIADNVTQKFIYLTDYEGQDYLISLPKEKAEFHNDILEYAIKHYGKDKNFDIHGGGKIRIDGDTIYLSDKSKVFGEADKQKVTEILKKVYPKSNIVLE